MEKVYRLLDFRMRNVKIYNFNGPMRTHYCSVTIATVFQHKTMLVKLK